MIEDVREKLKALRMKACADNLDQIMKTAEAGNWSALKTVGSLLDIELEARRLNRAARRFKDSKLTEKATIDGFDFHFHKSRKEQKGKILTLMDLMFVEQRKDAIFLGNPGVGKTFLAKCVAYAATQAGVKTLFTTAAQMLNHLAAAEADNSLLKKLHYYNSFDLLVCDEIGYLPLGAAGSNLFFQIVSQRHEQKSTLVTTNLPFADWGTIFDSTITATAIADRLVCGAKIIILEGPSYRKRMKKKPTDK